MLIIKKMTKYPLIKVVAFDKIRLEELSGRPVRNRHCPRNCKPDDPAIMPLFLQTGRRLGEVDGKSGDATFYILRREVIMGFVLSLPYSAFKNKLMEILI